MPAVSIFWHFDSLHLGDVWFIPFLWLFASFFYCAEISEHYNTKTGSRSDVGFLKNLFHHNGGYHYIHHMYPTIPWYKLREAHEALTSYDSDISTGFIDTYRQMKNNQ